jgi:hypothetical protein
LASYHVLIWPAGLRRTVKRELWFRRLSSLNPGLPLDTLSKKLKTQYTTAQRWAKVFCYPIRDMRKDGAVDWRSVDWTQRDAALSRELGVSRERVRQVRAEHGMGPSAERAAALQFEEYVAQNSHAVHGLSVADAIELSGSATTRNAARRVLRKYGIKAYRSEPRWHHLDWRLPNRDLALIHHLDPRQVASIRSRLKVGKAKWDVSGGRKVTSQAYRLMLTAEERRAAKSNGQAPRQSKATMTRSKPSKGTKR